MPSKTINNRPPVVCLVGSTRFMEAFFAVGWRLTLAGHIVLSVGVCKHAENHGGEALGQDVADYLDELHLRKIDLADWVVVINVGGYIGESTKREVDYSKKQGKKIVYLFDIPIPDEPPGVDEWNSWAVISSYADLALEEWLCDGGWEWIPEGRKAYE
ncbi:MAG: hypothetical protein SVK08_01575 [Halobacteriota archaeon]|nr:hypothetical protein [Halobacteriota archaeon]